MIKNKTFKLPGFADLHVHLRDPGQTHKEDFLSGTSAALAGGYTTVVDMPNNAAPIVSEQALEAKLASAQKQIVSDVGLYFGSLGDNLAEFDRVRERVLGLKLYLNVTTGNYLLGREHLVKIFTAWNNPRPIMVHAEADVIGDVLNAVAQTGQRAHVCHVSCRAELEPILAAKRRGLPVTCGVTPHHLFLTEEDAKRLGAYGGVKPSLKPKIDLDYLWQHIDDIDVVESDHAPHTREEKKNGTAPYGMPGLETTLPLMLQAEKEGRISRDEVLRLCATGPREILGLDSDEGTFVEVDPVEFEISSKGLQSKSQWTPFEGKKGFGKVVGVTIRGKKVYEEGRVIAAPGSGRIIFRRLAGSL